MINWKTNSLEQFSRLRAREELLTSLKELLLLAKNYLLKGVFSSLSIFNKYRVATGRVWASEKNEGICFFENQEFYKAGEIDFFSGRLTSQNQSFRVFVSHHSNITLGGKYFLPVDTEGRFFMESLIHLGKRNLEILSPEKELNSKADIKELKGTYCSLVSSWNTKRNYYHWLFDSLPRLGLLEKDDCQILIKGPLGTYEKETLEMLGCLDRVVVIDSDSVKIEKFLFASYTSPEIQLDPFACRWLRDQLLDEKVVEPAVKLFVKRGVSERNLLNENDVCEYLSSLGWVILDCSKLSVRDQISAFRRASIVMGVHGAALANIVWCQEKVKIIEFFPASRLVSSNENIAKVLGFDYKAYVYCSDKNHNFSLDVNSIQYFLTE